MTKFCTVLGGREILFRICVHYMFPLGEISCKCNYCGTNLLCIYIYIYFDMLMQAGRGKRKFRTSDIHFMKYDS
jgi:hypothetical protein